MFSFLLYFPTQSHKVKILCNILHKYFYTLYDTISGNSPSCWYSLKIRLQIFKAIKSYPSLDFNQQLLQFSIFISPLDNNTLSGISTPIRLIINFFFPLIFLILWCISGSIKLAFSIVIIPSYTCLSFLY